MDCIGVLSFLKKSVDSFFGFSRQFLLFIICFDEALHSERNSDAIWRCKLTVTWSVLHSFGKKMRFPLYSGDNRPPLLKLEIMAKSIDDNQSKSTSIDGLLANITTTGALACPTKPMYEWARTGKIAAERIK